MNGACGRNRCEGSRDPGTVGEKDLAPTINGTKRACALSLPFIFAQRS